MTKRSVSKKQPKCEDCFFRQNNLCALSLEDPCATFRPNDPEGLRPPNQMRFVFRDQGKATTTWAFPTARERQALYN